MGGFIYGRGCIRGIRPPAKVFIRSFYTNHFKDYLLIINDWLNTLTNIGSVDRSRTFAGGLLPKSISGAMSKRGRDIGNDTIELEIADRTIHKKGSGPWRVTA